MESSVKLAKLLLFVVCLAVISCDSVVGSAQQDRKVCRGTKDGLGHSDDPAQRYGMYRAMYTNCTYVDGNVELVFLNAIDNYDLSFLKDIKEITGYLLIVTVYADFVPLTGLRVIRGRTLFEDHGKLYSVFIANNYRPNLSATVGIKELQLVSLHEISAGNVFFHENSRLCYVDTINWDDIFGKGSSLKAILNETWPNCNHNALCHSSCLLREIDGSSVQRCWGSGSDMCQTYTRLICSQQCDNRCMGSQPSDCCHRECAVGCTGPTNSDCLACRLFDNYGRCEPYCPPEFIYSEKEFKNVPNPDVKYSYGTLCVNSCPDHLIADRGSCVHECPTGRVAGSDGKCADCEGPCPKQCPGTGDDSVNSANVHNFTGCTIIKGGIKILAHAFEGDEYNEIPPMSVSDLSVLETVLEVSDFVQIQLNHPNFTNLNFLRNLRIIKGQQLPVSGNALEVFDTSLTSLDLDLLEKVGNGGIAIVSNPQLCYAHYINWRKLAPGPTQKISIGKNMNRTECEANGEMCSPECSNLGCWGKLDHQCLSCANFSLDKRCLPSCNAVPNVYQSGPGICSHCHPECINGCSDSSADLCVACRHVKNGPYCMAECPPTKYADSAGVCQMCHKNCGDAGCTGPLNTVGPGACNSCDLVMFDNNSHNVTTCLLADSTCDEGYFKQRLQQPPGYPSLDGKHGCMRCHELCLTCNEYGLSYCTSCRHYRQYDRCVEKCESDFYLNTSSSHCIACDYRCHGCEGPSSAHCRRCRHYTMYQDLGKGDDGKQTFNCTEKCPQFAPFTFIVEKEYGEQLTLCVAEDYTSFGRHKITIIATVVPGVVIILSIVVIIIVVCCRQRALAEKKKMETAARIMGVETEMQPLNVSGIEPDRAVLRLTKESELRRGAMIGAGAFGTVYRGWWVPENESVKIPVAIKVLTSGNTTAQNTEMLEEARIMASVNHKFCVRILGICLTERMMIITQLMSHGCLRDFVKNNRSRINSQVMLNWCTQIAKGMEYLESRKIIHRDLAARNVLVQRPEHVRITDFGLAKLLNNKPEMCSTSAEKMPIKWLALECIRNRVYSHKSDVWSYGVMLWELFTYGETPYGNIRAIDIPSLLEKGERLPQPSMCTIDVFMLMIKCWMLDADSRPTFRELGDEFEKMAMDPSRYLVIEDDNHRRLLSVSSDPDNEARELLRQFSLPSDQGPEQILMADEYLQPRSTFNAVAVGNAPLPPPTTSSGSSRPPSVADADACRRRSRRSRFPFRRSNASDGSRTSSRYTSDPCNKKVNQLLLLASQQQQEAAAASNREPSTPIVLHSLPVDLLDGHTDGQLEEADDDNVWVVNNNFSPSRAMADPPPTASRNHSSSSPVGGDHYLTPRSTQVQQPAYLDFADDHVDQASTDEDVDRDPDETQQALGYVHMSPMSAGTFASNPEYFDDVVFSPPSAVKSPPLGNGSVPRLDEHEGSVIKRNGDARTGSKASDYYNCTPEPEQYNRLERQTSRV